MAISYKLTFQGKLPPQHMPQNKNSFPQNTCKRCLWKTLYILNRCNHFTT